MLWIAFKMYLWHVAFNYRATQNKERQVVNCFQNVSLTCRFQFFFVGVKQYICCELLSKCIFDMSLSILTEIIAPDCRLWIAFKMYLWHVAFNTKQGRRENAEVVNCFQNVSLTCRFQLPANTFWGVACCELLSKCIFDMSLSIWCVWWWWRSQLWIAFKMYLWHVAFNFWRKEMPQDLVVNCFQNVSLTCRFQSWC